MEHLPTELIGYLCLFLERPSLRSFRLTCKVFAQIGEEHFFRGFEFRLYPNHHRLELLNQLAAKASVAARLRCVSFESGVQLEYADYRCELLSSRGNRSDLGIEIVDSSVE